MYLNDFEKKKFLLIKIRFLLSVSNASFAFVDSFASC